MAQVKKFNIGGSVQKFKYGRIIKNGTVYEMDDENMKRLEQHIAAAKPDEQQSLANDWDLLMSGQDVTIDTHRNQRSTKPSDATKGQVKRLGKDKPVESRWHARNKTYVDAYNRATKHLGDFDLNVQKEEPSTQEKKKLSANSSAFEYITNDDGSKTYRSLPNTDEMNFFDEVAAYLAGDDEYRSGYDVTGWAGFKNIDNWYKTLADKSGFMSGLRAKILQGQDLTNDEKDYLTAIGLTQNITTNAKVEEKMESDELKTIKDKAWLAFNENNLWDNSVRDDRFVYDSVTGKYSPGSNFKLPELPTSTGYYFNDDFINNHYGYDWLRNKVYFGGKWYNGEDLSNPESELYKMLNSKQYDYYNKNRRGDYAAADAVLKTHWNGYFKPTTDYKDSRLGSFYENENLRFEDKNYATKNTRYNNVELDDSYNIHRIMDMTNEIGIDPLGRRPVYYTIVDAYGNPVTLDGSIQMINGLPIYDLDKFSGLYDGSTTTDQNTKFINRSTSDEKNKLFYNRYLQDDGLLKAYIDPGDNSKVHASIDTSLGGDDKNVFMDMPKEIYELLTNKDFLKGLENNPTIKNRFIDLVQGKIFRFTPKDILERSNPLNNFGLINPENWIDISTKNLQDAGLKKEQAEALINYFKEYYKSGYYAPKPGLKNGGIVKAQTGLKVWQPEPFKKLQWKKPVDKMEFEELELPEQTWGIAPKTNDYLTYSLPGTKEAEAKLAASKVTTPNMLGQQTRDVETPNFLDYTQDVLSGIRYLNTVNNNKATAEILKKGARDAALAQMKDAAPLRPINTRIVAGNAEIQAANEMEQYRPPVTNDYNAYVANDIAMKVNALSTRMSGIRQQSAQHLDNLNKQAEALHEKAMRDWEITNQNRAIMGNLAASNAQVDAATRNAIDESKRQFILEKQHQLDQDIQAARSIKTAEDIYKAQRYADDESRAEFNKLFGKDKYDASNPLHVEQYRGIYNKWKDYVFNEQQKSKSVNLPGYIQKAVGLAKNGTKLRSTEDQIKINRNKSVDQNWVDNSRSVRKAISKLNDRAHDILMKILS